MSVKVFHCLLMFGVVVCQNGEFNPTIEGSGSGEVDSGSTLNTTVVTKIITNSLEDTTDEVGSGDDNIFHVTEGAKPTTTTSTEFTMATRPIDEEGSGASGGGSGYETSTDPSSSKLFKSIVKTDPKIVRTVGGGSTVLRTTMPNAIIDSDSKRTEKGSTVESSYFTSKEAETRKPATTTRTMGADPVTDIEVINSPTASPGRSTEKKTSTIANVIDDPTEDPSLLGNTAKASGNRKSQPAISFTTGIIIGVVVGALLAFLVILLLVYRLRKKDEGSYSLEEPITGYTKQEPGSPVSGKEYLA